MSKCIKGVIHYWWCIIKVDLDVVELSLIHLKCQRTIKPSKAHRDKPPLPVMTELSLNYTLQGPASWPECPTATLVWPQRQKSITNAFGTSKTTMGAWVASSKRTFPRMSVMTVKHATCYPQPLRNLKVTGRMLMAQSDCIFIVPHEVELYSRVEHWSPTSAKLNKEEWTYGCSATTKNYSTSALQGPEISIK